MPQNDCFNTANDINIKTIKPTKQSRVTKKTKKYTNKKEINIKKHK